MGIANDDPRRMLKKAVQQGRSERRPEAYSLRYVEGLNDARTKLAGFFSILLVSVLRLYRSRREIPVETVKLFRREIFILESGESGLIDRIFDRVVKIR